MKPGNFPSFVPTQQQQSSTLNDLPQRSLPCGQPFLSRQQASCDQLSQSLPLQSFPMAANVQSSSSPFGQGQSNFGTQSSQSSQPLWNQPSANIFSQPQAASQSNFASQSQSSFGLPTSQVPFSMSPNVGRQCPRCLAMGHSPVFCNAPTRAPNTISPPVCFICRATQHWVVECPLYSQWRQSPTAINRACFLCGDSSHWMQRCPLRTQFMQQQQQVLMQQQQAMHSAPIPGSSQQQAPRGLSQPVTQSTPMNVDAGPVVTCSFCNQSGHASGTCDERTRWLSELYRLHVHQTNQEQWNLETTSWRNSVASDIQKAVDKCNQLDTVSDAVVSIEDFLCQNTVGFKRSSLIGSKEFPIRTDDSDDGNSPGPYEQQFMRSYCSPGAVFMLRGSAYKVVRTSTDSVQATALNDPLKSFIFSWDDVFRACPPWIMNKRKCPDDTCNTEDVLSNNNSSGSSSTSHCNMPNGSVDLPDTSAPLPTVWTHHSAKQRFKNKSSSSFFKMIELLQARSVEEGWPEASSLSTSTSWDDLVALLNKYNVSASLFPSGE